LRSTAGTERDFDDVTPKVAFLAKAAEFPHKAAAHE
jgi:hypothetical protein